jgi:hypothetical protein
VDIRGRVWAFRQRVAVFWYREVGEGACGTCSSVDGESSMDVFAVGMVCVRQQSGLVGILYEDREPEESVVNLGSGF